MIAHKAVRVLPTDGDEPLLTITRLKLYLADANGENWQDVTPERWGQIEHIARLALSAMKGGDRG